MPMWWLDGSKDKEGKQVSRPDTVVSDVMSFPLAMNNGLTGLMARQTPSKACLGSQPIHVRQLYENMWNIPIGGCRLR